MYLYKRVAVPARSGQELSDFVPKKLKRKRFRLFVGSSTTAMFRRRKAVESERSPTSTGSKSNNNSNHNEEGMWFKKPASNHRGAAAVSSSATNAATTASLVHLVASSATPDRRSTINSSTMSRDSYRFNYSHQRGQDDDDESTQRPDETTLKRPPEPITKRPFSESSPPLPPSSAAPPHVSPVTSIPAAAAAPKNASMLKGGDLIALIVCEEWDQASKALDDNPKVARMPQQMTLEGNDSQGLPLHLTACSRPPVSGRIAAMEMKTSNICV